MYDHRFDPDLSYSPHDVYLLLGIPLDTQAAARDAGELSYRQGDFTPRYDGRWILDWARRCGVKVNGSRAAQFERRAQAQARGGDFADAVRMLASVDPEAHAYWLAAQRPELPINPTDTYTTEQVWILLGLTPADLEHAAGHGLTRSYSAFDRQWVFVGSWLLSWIDREAPTLGPLDEADRFERAVQINRNAGHCEREAILRTAEKWPASHQAWLKRKGEAPKLVAKRKTAAATV